MNVHARTSRRRQLRHRSAGFSLFELLLALGILAAILALSLPLTWRMLNERELASTEENIAAELLKARAHAQESGKPVEVVVTDGAPARLSMRYFSTSARDRREWSRKPDRGATESTSTARRERSAGRGNAESRGTAGAWQDSSDWYAESELVSSVRVGSAKAADERDAGPATASPSAPDLAVREPLRLAVFMPDGSILFAAALRLRHDCGLESVLTVDPWTGQTAVERGVDPATAANASDETAKDDAASGDDAHVAPEHDDDALDEFEVDESGRG
jgi:Tfp pilus assembly protein FimT